MVVGNSFLTQEGANLGAESDEMMKHYHASTGNHMWMSVQTSYRILSACLMLL